MDDPIDKLPATLPPFSGASSAQPPPAMTDRIGKYEILSKLGQGGMGVVYKAHDPMIGRDVAIKVIHEHALQDAAVKPRFYREARSAGRLSHPNITIIYEVNEEDGRPYLVMEYLEGQDLRSLLKAGTALSKKRKLQIAAEICKGLLYAHQKKVVHRDIKPENIRILPDGSVKIMDFGIARVQSETATLTQTNTSMGTPRYMAPEQVKGEQLDHRADIFAFGVLFHELFSGATPFTGENLTTLIYKILHTEPEPLEIAPEELREDLQEIVSMCLAKDPDDRYASIAEVLQDVQAIEILDEDTLTGPASGGQTAPLSKSASRRTRRRRTTRKAASKPRKGLWITLGILLALGLAAGGVAVFQPNAFSQAAALFQAAPPPADPSATPDEESAVAALSITPNQVVMGVGDQTFLNVEVWNTQGAVIDMQTLDPATIQWNTADSSIAAVAGVAMVDAEGGLGGVITGLQEGKTTITVAIGGVVQFIPVEVGISSQARAEAKQQYLDLDAPLADAALSDSAVQSAFERVRDTFGEALEAEMQADVAQKIERLSALIATFQTTEAHHQQDSLTIFEKRAAWQAYLDQALSLRPSPATEHARQRIGEIDEVVAGSTTLEVDTFVTCDRTVAGGSTGALRLCRESALKRTFAPGTKVYLNAKTNAPRSARIRWTWHGPEGTVLQQKNTRVLGVQGYRIWDLLKASDTQKEGDYQIRIYNEKDILIGRHTFTITN